MGFWKTAIGTTLVTLTLVAMDCAGSGTCLEACNREAGSPSNGNQIGAAATRLWDNADHFSVPAYFAMLVPVVVSGYAGVSYVIRRIDESNAKKKK